MQVQEGANNDEIVVDLCGLYGKSGWLSVTVRNDTYWFLSAPPTTHPPTIFCSFLDVFSLNQASKRCLNRQPDKTLLLLQTYHSEYFKILYSTSQSYVATVD